MMKRKISGDGDVGELKLVVVVDVMIVVVVEG